MPLNDSIRLKVKLDMLFWLRLYRNASFTEKKTYENKISTTDKSILYYYNLLEEKFAAV